LTQQVGDIATGGIAIVVVFVDPIENFHSVQVFISTKPNSLAEKRVYNTTLRRNRVLKDRKHEIHHIDLIDYRLIDLLQ
jgi:hypothetical protein